MYEFSLIFIFFLFLSLFVDIALLLRNITHIVKRRSQVPDAFKGQIDLDSHQKAADYTVARNRISSYELFFGTLLILIWTFGGGLELLDTLWRSLALNGLVTGVGLLISMALIASLIELPISYYKTFKLEQRFGFNKSTPKLFFTDLIKQSLLMLVIGAPLAWVALWLMDSAGQYWWLYLWAVWMGFGLLMMWAYPTFIAPLFNKFEPLEEGELRDRIEALLERCGFASNGIFIMDGSKRSSHGNAYFTGLGKQKRIVFFDTLIESLTPEEIEGVLAHELGHFRMHHIPKRILSSAVISLGALALLGWLVSASWFYSDLGVSTPSNHVALALFMLVSPAFGFFLTPLFSWFSRKHEYEADDFAAAQSTPEHLISALVKLYKENASTLTPDPLYSAFHDSHPPAPLRVAHLSAKISS
ncbi:peptidase M48 [Solemya pervernicosa gill symbiont]|uniref:Peptidase M48 n=2 Tax=Gammaproteobacteria incertae sedis TaxID=118884 RepID=A0A1T2L571_9GAMM|nr:M48 family metallopeptidase [Candidatus Reidiella endopervernicosa]OOZ40211.1 peptidase M48 [Solemya pervernicosa gill symbiont]QKQ27133.1 M48 family metallopeptidase [Candidatus Reidiella endopervernicosa]